MRIHGISCIDGKNAQTELSGFIDDFRVHYTFPSELKNEVSADPFLAAALLPAMKRGESIVIDKDVFVSPRMLANLLLLQAIYTTWLPQLELVSIEAESLRTSVSREAAASFFSGGVDGMYTLLKNEEAIDDLICVHGIDVALENEELFQQIITANQVVADHLGKRLVPVKTNVRHLGYFHNISWAAYQGSGLASIALALGYSKTYIASSHTYNELVPLGSHPLTDALWSTESRVMIHDGAEAARTKKLQRIAQQQIAVENLRVCWQSKGYNCCECEKCVRTMVSLRALGIKTSTFPRDLDLKSVRQLTVWGDTHLIYFEENARLAEEAGDRELLKAIQVPIRKYKKRRAIACLDETFLHGVIRRTKNALRKPQTSEDRLKMANT